MPSSNRKARISRRNLLKATAAAGGGLAASMFLPGKWVKPAIRVGVLPVHAQTSNPTQTLYQIVDSTAEQETGDGCFLSLGVTISPADDGIQMQVVINDLEDNRTETITATTVAGVATFDTSNPICTGARTTTVTFSFVDAALCSTNCSIQRPFPLPQ